MPELFIIAGCNGAGKTTAAYNLLPDVFQTVEFINADEIARGLNEHDVDKAAYAAGKIMLGRIEQLIAGQTSFAFETTLSGLSYLRTIERAKEKGFSIILFFVYLENAEIAIERVALRVSKGGHNIPTEVIRRRYSKGIKNFSTYSEKADSWYLFDNSSSEYLLIAKNISAKEEIINFDVLKTIKEHE